MTGGREERRKDGGRGRMWRQKLGEKLPKTGHEISHANCKPNLHVKIVFYKNYKS